MTKFKQFTPLAIRLAPEFYRIARLSSCAHCSSTFGNE